MQLLFHVLLQNRGADDRRAKQIKLGANQSMNNSTESFLSFLALVSFLIFSVKCGVTVQRIRRHDLFMYWGQGNSLSSLIAYTLVFLWGILAVFNFAASGVIKSDASKVFSPTEIQSSDSTIKNLTPKTTPDVERKLTSEEIHQLEVKMQYSGDDEIIRKRLGLTPKSPQVTNSSPDQQPILGKNPKVDDPAPEAPKAEAPSE